MRRTLLAALAACLAMSAPSFASELVLTVRDSNGKPVADAVAQAYPAAASRTPVVKGDYEEAQQNLAFIPFVLTVPVGATVRFPNHDRVKHQVYSFSPAKTFTLDLYGRDDRRSVTFDRAGTIALGCNIHDAMRGYIRVVDTAHYGQSAADGVIRLRDLPAGPVRVVLWRPFLRAPNNEMILQLVMPLSGQLAKTVDVALRAPPAKSNY